MKMRHLTARKKKFIAEYVDNGGNATRAALAAYNVTYGTARMIGCENLTKPSIRREIDKHLQKVELSIEDAVWAIKEALLDKRRRQRAS